MKLLSWIRTTKENGFHSSKEFKGVFCCLRAQISSQVSDIRTNSFSFSGPSHDPNPPRMEEESLLDEDGFCGFLAIGTLGMDPETPKLGASLAEEDVTGIKEMSELITAKLEKFLEEYPKDSGNKWVERSDAEEDRESQHYDLFRSSIELPKGSKEVKKKKGLLRRLFKRRQGVQGESSYMEKHGTRDLINMIFEKLRGDSSKTRNEDDNSIPNKKDLKKNVQISRTKVHPVLYTPAKDENTIDDRRSCINRCALKVPSLTAGSLHSSSILRANMTRENWITTDKEYLVLEL